ncbi:hypothetical protein O181_036976 [Austropuccinia psidii MF-1]|uniref:Uncharacterized protein n=1 Tax=Austropuccinia psidii MF-1 TaxID=1389203 RepID=A0A9Q3HAD3_9BASI|nr:hypothetical protein [Austropuccinia psidii MF-1]
MSSSDPCKSCSGSVSDWDSDSIIEYVQTRSLINSNTPPAIPITSLMNVSGLNIDVGNLMAQNSMAWTIPNISVTPITMNPTNTQMHVSEGPGRKPKISSKANIKSNFSFDFLLNPGGNPMESQEPFGKCKQPSLNIPSGSQAHMGYEKWVYGG